MSREANGTATALRKRARRRSFLLAGAVLIALAASASSASAALTEEAVEGVGSTVESVEAIPQTVPVPNAVPPPPPPVAPPPAAQVQPEAATPPSGSAGEAPAPTDVAGVAGNATGSVEGSGGEATQQAAAPAGDEAGGGSISGGSAPVSSKPVDRAARAGSSAPPSIAVAKTAPLHRWLARVWPAIALGGGVRVWSAGSLATLLRPVVAVAARVESVIPSATPVAGDSRPFGRPDSANAPQPASPDVAAPIEGGKAFYLVLFAALSALLGFTIWREFRSALWPGAH